MSVNARTVQGRRTLHFSTLEEMIADAEKLVSAPNVKTLGNWPLNQLLTHLAKAMNASIDGIPFRAPWYLRFAGYFVKRRMLQKGVTPGYSLPKKVEPVAYPECSSPVEALAIFKKAVDRIRTEQASANHPIFGKLTHDEWILLHLRHSEMHLSFAVYSCDSKLVGSDKGIRNETNDAQV